MHYILVCTYQAYAFVCFVEIWNFDRTIRIYLLNEICYCSAEVE